MARDILSEFGPNTPRPRNETGSSGMSTDGGKPYVKSEKYSMPVGPINGTKGPGIGDVEPRYGMGGERLGEAGEREFTGSPGNHGRNHGNKGSQGSY